MESSTTPQPPADSGSAGNGRDAAGPSAEKADAGRRMRFLNIIAWVAVIDVILLIPLVWASRWVADRHDIVAVLGPVHGFLFLVLIGLCAYGSLQKWWGWWFPILVVVTLGPLGSLIGDWIIRRQIKAEAG